MHIGGLRAGKRWDSDCAVGFPPSPLSPCQPSWFRERFRRPLRTVHREGEVGDRSICQAEMLALMEQACDVEFLPVYLNFRIHCHKVC